MWKLRLSAICVVSLLLVVASGCKRGAGKTTPIAVPARRVASQETPKDAFRKVFDSINKGDKRGILESVYAVGEESKTVEALAEFAESARDFDAAFVKAFGRKSGFSFPGVEDFEESMEGAEVKIDGDKASVSTSDLSEPVRFIQKAGAWKVLAADVIGVMQGGDIKNMDVVWDRCARITRSHIAEIRKPGARAEEVEQNLEVELDKVAEIAELKEDSARPPADKDKPPKRGKEKPGR